MAQSEDYHNRLLRLRREEMQSRAPVALPPDFYEATRRFLGDLDALLAEELRRDPTSARSEMTRQTRAGVLSAVSALLEWRLEKIGRRSVHAAFQSEDWTNLLPEERALAEQLREQIASFAARFAPFLSPVPTTPSPPAGAPPAPSLKEPVLPPRTGAASDGTASVPPSPPGREEPSDLAVVRVLKDGAPVMAGPEDAVDLHAEDLITLPEAKAELLVRSGLAERIEPPRTRPTQAPP